MKNILNRLIQHEVLSRQESKDILVGIANKAYNESEIASFLTVYMMRSIQLEELEGFRDALLELCLAVDLSAYEPIDLCGTGGDGKDTFNISVECLDFRGLLVSFGQSSGMVPNINLHKTFNPKSLYYTRPTLMHYTSTRAELENCSNNLFKKIKNNSIKENIFRRMRLKNASEAHTILQSRKSTGSIILKP